MREFVDVFVKSGLKMKEIIFYWPFETKPIKIRFGLLEWADSVAQIVEKYDSTQLLKGWVFSCPIFNTILIILTLKYIRLLKYCF